MISLLFDRPPGCGLFWSSLFPGSGRKLPSWAWTSLSSQLYPVHGKPYRHSISPSVTAPHSFCEVGTHYPDVWYAKPDYWGWRESSCILYMCKYWLIRTSSSWLCRIACSELTPSCRTVWTIMIRLSSISFNKRLFILHSLPCTFVWRLIFPK